jgi:radical SAM superfamily enzyme YgiQ (UPF0313 family)
MSKGTIVFLAANASYSHTNLAGWYLRSYAERAGWTWHEVEALRNDSLISVLQRVAGLKPDILAASFYLFNADFLSAFISRFKALMPSCLVIGGGPQFLGDNFRFLERHPEIDLVIRGEGEQAFGEWLTVWRTPGKWKEIRGLCALIEGHYVDNGKAGLIANLDGIPTPFKINLNAFKKPFLLMETSRGCSGKCAFCTSAGSRVRFFSEQRFRGDLALISAAGIRDVHLADRTFNENGPRSAAFIRIMREEFKHMKFHLEIDPGRLSSAAVRELAQAGAGRFHLEVGVQTTRPEALRALGRTVSGENAFSGVKQLCSLKNLSVHIDLIAGLPETNLADLFADLQKTAMMKPDEIQLELLKVLPGTRLGREVKKFGIIAATEPPYEVLQTESMSHDDLVAADRLSKLVDWLYNPPELHQFFIAALETVPGFIHTLADFAGGITGGVQAPSLENRFRLLEEYCRRHAPGLISRLGYEWLKMGFSPQHGICRATPWKKPLPSGAVLVEGDGAAVPQRVYLAELERPYLFVYSRPIRRRASAIYAV